MNLTAINYAQYRTAQSTLHQARFSSDLTPERKNELLADLSKSFTGNSVEAEQVRKEIVMLSQTEHPFLLLGPSGTGKNVIAEWVKNNGARHDKPFETANLAGIDDTFMHSTLFGHEQGAYTGAVKKRSGLVQLANGGTLLIDELNQATKPLQAALLRVLDTSTFQPLGSDKSEKVDVRFIGAASENLVREVRKRNSRFIPDLLYRFGQVVFIPGLAKRKEDIPAIIATHLPPNITMTSGALDKMCSYHWPGNARELKAAIAGAVMKAQFNNRNVIEPEDIKLLHRQSKASGRKGSTTLPTVNIQALTDMAMTQAMAAEGGNMSKAAERLGITRGTLHKWMRGKKPQSFQVVSQDGQKRPAKPDTPKSSKTPASTDTATA